MHVLVTAAEKKLVEQYVSIFKIANIPLASLETEAFALVRSLVGQDPSMTLIMDIGAKNTDFSLIDSGVPVLNRSIDFGGDGVTDTLARAFGVPRAVAKQMKHDLPQLPPRATTDAAPILTQAFAPLANEIAYIRGMYPTERSANVSIEKIILTGGSSWIPALIPFLTQRFNITVIMGDPWARVATPTDLRPILDTLGPRMSVAVGLAMREQ